MAPNKPRYCDTVVAALRTAVTDGNFGLSDVPALLKRVIREDMWRERELTQTGERVRFTRFVDFVRERPLEGLGTSVEQLQRLCTDDPEALDLLDQAAQQRRGNPTGRNQYAVGNDNNVSISTNGKSRSPLGNSRSYALRRLRKDRPDLHARVLSGEVSAHAAMVMAGFRERHVVLPLNVPKAAAAITRTFTSEQIADLIELLQEYS